MATSKASSLLMGAAESLLHVDLPDYDKLRRSLAIKLVTALVCFLILVPLVGLAIFLDDREAEQAYCEQPNAANKKKAPTPKNNNKEEPSDAKSLASISLGGCFLVCSYLLLSKSPNNYLTSRAVYESPLFSADECRHLLDLSNQAANRNYQAALAVPADQSNETIQAWKREPVGWQKTRHGNYPTTDLNLAIDPFTTEDRAWLGNLLDRRLAPTLSRIYGIPANSIRANDMFVVRYDAGQRVQLDNHTDDSDISVNILLNDDFEDGGTVFWNRITNAPFAHVRPAQPGTLLAHSARINHEGAAISSGTRIILVGFLSVDRLDPFTHEPTGLSLFASWLSMPWMAVRLKAGYMAAKYRNDNEESYLAIMFKRLWGILEGLGDAAATHHHTVLVNDTRAEDYLTALDDAHEKRGPKQAEASWFRGQQISLNFDGTIMSEWAGRTKNANRFEEL